MTDSSHGQGERLIPIMLFAKTKEQLNTVCVLWMLDGTLEGFLTKDAVCTALPFLLMTTQTAPFLHAMEYLTGITSILIDLVMLTTSVNVVLLLL